MALLIDTRELARTARTLEGRLTVAEMPRLASLLAREDGALQWRVRGERRERPDGGHEDLMHAELSAELWMQCVRCLDDAPVALRVANWFRLVASDEQAEREDLEDSQFDVLTGGARFDLGELIEDEAIMALPAFGRHEGCELPEAAAPEGRATDAPDTVGAPDGTAPDPAGSPDRTARDRGARDPAGVRGEQGKAGEAGGAGEGGDGQQPGERIKPFADLAEMMKRRH